VAGARRGRGGGGGRGRIAQTRHATWRAPRQGPGMVLYKTARSKRRTIPDWVKVQAGEDAGATIIEIWREYAARVARPYDISGFRKEFRKWQAAAPAESVKEFAASDYYWQGKASVRPDILVLEDGATVRVRGGHLETFSRGVTNLFDAGAASSQAERHNIRGVGRFAFNSSRKVLCRSQDNRHIDRLAW
jgi:hypothetical protein